MLTDFIIMHTSTTLFPTDSTGYSRQQRLVIWYRLLGNNGRVKRATDAYLSVLNMFQYPKTPSARTFISYW